MKESLHMLVEFLCGLSDDILPPVNSCSASSTLYQTFIPSWAPREIQDFQKEDVNIYQMITWLQEKSVPLQFPKVANHALQTLWLQRKFLTLRDGILYRCWEDVPGGGKNKRLQLVLPHKMRTKVLEDLHNSPSGSHLGVMKTLQKVQYRFYWPGQRKDVEDWCKACQSCGSRKNPPKTRRAPMQIIQSSTPMQRVAMDILGPLPVTSMGNKYILVIADYFTKWVEAFPMPNMEATTVARLFVDQFVCRFGTPEFLHTDQGRNFESTIIKESCKLLGITKTRTSPYHPQSDGLVERFNRTVLNMLSIMTQEDEHCWDLHLPHVMMAYRTSVQETTGFTPFSLMFGREARLPIDVVFGSPPNHNSVQSTNEYSKQMRQRLEDSYNRVRKHMNLQQRRQKDVYDHRTHGNPFKVNDLVWLHSPVIPKGLSRKFHHPWQGPFKIMKNMTDTIYRIQSLQNPRKRLVVHFNRLKPYETHPEEQESNFPKPGNNSNSESTFIEEEEEENVLLLPNHELQTIRSDNQEPVEPVQELRRSTRVSRPPNRYGDLISY